MAKADKRTENKRETTAKTLQTLFRNVAHRGVGVVPGKAIDEVVFNSQNAHNRTLFVALPGQNLDGHTYVEDAIDRGCSALVIEEGRFPDSFLTRAVKKQGVSWLIVADCRQALGQISAAFYDHPAENMTLIGITGTNGKTTTSYLLESMLASVGNKVGVIGTVNYRYGGVHEDAPLTTPEPVAMQSLLRRMADKGVTHTVMEVSSHALSQKRISGLEFDVALFTNLSRDHLDFHATMEEYFDHKKLLFTEHLKDKGTAVVLTGLNTPTNEDWGSRLIRDLNRNTKRRSFSKKLLDCGVDQQAIVIKRHRITAHGLSAKIDTPSGPWTIQSKLVGSFNVHNIMGAIGVGVALGLDPKKAAKGLASVDSVPGRLEQVSNPFGKKIFVDYAHTPDALENVLLTLREITVGRLVVVFGCGGDRDIGKRPIMGKVAGRLADVVLLTSDNPRSENPGTILNQIERGVLATLLSRHRAEWIFAKESRRGFDVIESRREAIQCATQNAGPKDVVLISGKGHEDYQISQNGRCFFDDRLEAVKQNRIIQW